MLFRSEVLLEYRVDPTDLPVDVDSYLKLTCYELLDKYSNLNEQDRIIALLSANVALVLENFLLHLKSIKT